MTTTVSVDRPNGPVLFCWLSSVVVVCNAAGGRAGRPSGAWTVGRPTLHGGPVVLRTVKATPCFIYHAGTHYVSLSFVKTRKNEKRAN